MGVDLRVGTSGWTYDDWAGTFYPPDITGPARLEYYVTQFNCVEINATFYRLPTVAMISAWNRRMPEGFHLVVKASRRITHLKRLADCSGEVREFFQRVGPLKQLRVILWQLPPSFRPDLARLEDFLKSLQSEAVTPAGVRHAVEFRHKSWWESDAAEVLARYQAAFVAVSHPQLPGDITCTTDFLYLRFHGLGRQLYRYNYSADELADWAQRVAGTCRSGKVKAVYAFFNNDYDAHAVANARLFRQLLAERLPA